MGSFRCGLGHHVAHFGRVAVTIVLAAALLPTGAVWAADGGGQDVEAQQTAPVWPEGAELTASDVTQTGVTLSWPEATDDASVTGYHLYRSDGTLVADLDAFPPPTTHTVTGLQPGTTYTFTVEAHDANGNESDDGPSQTVTTLDDGTAPVWPEGAELAASDITQTGVKLSWPQATDDIGVTGYHLYRSDGTLVADLDAFPPPTTHTVTDLQPGTTYTFTVEAHDRDGNESDDGPSQTVTTLDEVPAGTACPINDVPDAPFTDREEIPSVHRGNVDCAAWADIVDGFPDNTYRPTAGVRRDQMASFIVRTLDGAGFTLPEPTGDRFTDVPAGSTHDDAIHRLAAAGIVQGGAGGADATSYSPAQRVRRDQMASFLLRAAEHATGQSLESDTSTFPDVSSANPHFANVNGASATGLATGFADGTYRPRDGVRRDQMATFVIRLFTGLVEDTIGD